jgi:uncharacterized protein YuzE
MDIRYFPDTDTLLMRFSQAAIVETRDLTDDVLVEFDEAGQLVSMTIEQAKTRAGLDTITVQMLPVLGPLILDLRHDTPPRPAPIDDTRPHHDTPRAGDQDLPARLRQQAEALSYEQLAMAYEASAKMDPRYAELAQYYREAFNKRRHWLD